LAAAKGGVAGAGEAAEQAERELAEWRRARREQEAVAGLLRATAPFLDVLSELG
jgi:hypothetical protein